LYVFALCVHLHQHFLTESCCCSFQLSQLWAASGQLQQQLHCDRELYFPGLVVLGPLVKQVPADSSADAQQGKRTKLASGQYRRSFREALCDSTPPGTPFKPGRQQQQQYEAQQQCELQQQHDLVRPPVALEERLLSQAFASTSSSSSMGPGQLHRQSVSGAAVPEADCDSVEWPIHVPSKQKRSSRSRRTALQQWPPVLQDHGYDGSSVAAADAAAGSAAGQHQQQVLLPCALQQLVAPMQVDEQQPVHVASAGVVQPAPAALHCVQQCAVREIAAAFPSKASVGLAADVKAATAASGDVSPGHETSQSSEMTVCRDSPRAVAGVALSSWPSSSTESDCQVHMHDFDGVHKAGAAAVAAVSAAAAVDTAVAAGKRPQAVPESASWPVNGVC
jgi:hypothetical protein